MRLTTLGVIGAFLVAGAALVAEEKKSHKCPMATIMCPQQGDCSGQCRSFCDKGGEALTALRARVAAAVKEKTKADPGPHLSGACKTKECADCQKLMDGVFSPVLKDKINARFGNMNQNAKHEVQAANGKVTEVKCTFLTGKLCDACVNEMKATSLEKYEALEKEHTK